MLLLLLISVPRKSLAITKDSFSLEFKKFRRAHILNKNGYDIADVEIHIYTNGRCRRRIGIT